MTATPLLDAPAQAASRRPPSAARGAVSGVVAAGLALAAGELVTAVADSPTSLVTAVGSEFIDRFAASLKDLAVSLFGTNDKVALVTGIDIVSLLLGAVIGVSARRRPVVALLGFGAFGLVGAWSLSTDPQGSATTAMSASAIAVAVGVVAYRWLVASGGLSVRPHPAGAADADRRRFVVGASALAALAASGALVAHWLRAHDSIDAARSRTVLPRARSRVPVPAAQPFEIRGLSPYVTPTDDFYRIDTALSTPQVDAGAWRLRIGGMVDRPFELSFDELLALGSVEEPVTIACVSNEVGGNLVGNAIWQGVPLADLLERAGVRVGAEQVVGRSVDGFTAGFPRSALDGRTAIVAYAMNGEPLPAAHGYPARLLVEGLYGYVSATKWLEEIELTTWDGFDGYWVPRGWAKEGSIKTASRMDVPRSGADLPAGTHPIAGVAWAPGRGIDRVEVQVDDENWQPAELGAVASDATWVQWHLSWHATPGEHTLRVRAVDGDGVTQIEEPSRPAPDGATGWHIRRIRIT